MEDDEDVLKHYTADMKKIRNDWRSRTAKQKTSTETDAFLESMKKAFIQMAGDNNRKD